MIYDFFLFSLNFQTFCISLYILYIKNAKFMLLQSDFQSPPENKPTNYFHFFSNPIPATRIRMTCFGQQKFISPIFFVIGFFPKLLLRPNGLKPINEATIIHGQGHIHSTYISSWIKLGLRYPTRPHKNLWRNMTA